MCLYWSYKVVIKTLLDNKKVELVLVVQHVYGNSAIKISYLCTIIIKYYYLNHNSEI